MTRSSLLSRRQKLLIGISTALGLCFFSQPSASQVGLGGGASLGGDGISAGVGANVGGTGGIGAGLGASLGGGDGNGTGAGASVGGSGGVNAGAGAGIGGSGSVSAGAGANLGGSDGVSAGLGGNLGGSGGVNAGVQANVGGAGGVDAGVGANLGGRVGGLGAGAAVSVGGTPGGTGSISETPARTPGPNGSAPGSTPAPALDSQTRAWVLAEYRSMTGPQRKQLRRTCAAVLEAPMQYDQGLGSICQLLSRVTIR